MRLKRLLGIALLVAAFFIALSGVIGLGNGLGPIEAALVFLGAAVVAAAGWWVWGYEGRKAVR